MYSRSAGFATAIKSNARRIYTKTDINGGDGNGGITLYGDGTDGAVVDINLEEVMDSGQVSIGTAPSSSCKMTIRLPSTPLALVNGTFVPYVGLMISGAIEWIPLGKFYITEVQSNNAATASITGYDGMYLLEKKYVPNKNITFPASVGDILADIQTQTSAPIAAFQSGTYVPEYYECTCREMVAWIGGLMGAYTPRFDRSGTLRYITFYYTANPLTISGDEQYMNGVRSTTSFTIQSVTGGTQEKNYTCGSGAGITFTNPYATQAKVDYIGNTLIGRSYLPMTCEWRGDPCLEAGDVVFVDVNGVVYTTYVMSHTLSVAGGLKETIRAEAPDDAEIHFDTTPTQSKINQVYTALQQALADSAALINGTEGGVFEVTDNNSDGVNDGWVIKASADANWAGECIVANYNGIGFSTDGGATYNVAITTSGEINGQFIRAGSISADQISVGGETLGSYVYVGHRRPNDTNTPIVMRVGSLTAGRVTEIKGDRTSIYDVGVYSNYISDTSITEDAMDASSLFYYTADTLVMQTVKTIQFGSTSGSLVIQPLASGMGFMAV